MGRTIAKLTVALLIAVALVGAPTMQATVTPNGNTSVLVSHTSSSASHNPCNMTGWHVWKPKKPKAFHGKKVKTYLRKETVRPGGRWIACSYSSWLHGYMGPHRWTKTVPHR